MKWLKTVFVVLISLLAGCSAVAPFHTTQMIFRQITQAGIVSTVLQIPFALTMDILALPFIALFIFNELWRRLW